MDSVGQDLTPVQYATLVEIKKKPGLDQASLAAIIAYDRATIGGVIDRLERKQLVERSVSKTDRRARTLSITPLGEKTLDIVAPQVEAAQDDLVENLTQAEAKQLRELLRKAIGS